MRTPKTTKASHSVFPIGIGTGLVEEQAFRVPGGEMPPLAQRQRGHRA